MRALTVLRRKVTVLRRLLTVLRCVLTVLRCELVESAPLWSHASNPAEGGAEAMELAEATVGAPSTAAVEDAVAHFWGVVYGQRFRSQKDRSAAWALYCSHAGEQQASVESRHQSTGEVGVRVDASTVQLGRACLERHHHAARGSGSAVEGSSQLTLTPGQAATLEAAAHTLQCGWMVLLVGGAARAPPLARRLVRRRRPARPVPLAAAAGRHRWLGLLLVLARRGSSASLRAFDRCSQHAEGGGAEQRAC